MAHQIISTSRPKEVSRHNPCPICGKPDWCFTTASVYSFENGTSEEFVFSGCMRVTDNYVQGYDGNFYMFEKTSTKGASIYEEVMQRGHRHELLGIDASVKTSSDYKKRVAKTKTILCKNEIVSVEKRDEIYREFLSMLVLEDYHKESLKGDNWDEKMIKDSLFRSIPPTGKAISDVIKKRKSGTVLTEYEEICINLKNKPRKQIAQSLFLKFGDLEGVPGFYLNHSKFDNTNFWDFSGKQGIIMPMFDLQGRIFGLRIRLDNPPIKGGKYKWFSSYYEELISETDTEQVYDNTMKKGTSIPGRVSYLFPDFMTPFLFVTEGEKKQRTVVSKKGIACANVPGVSSFSTMIEDIPTLKEMGIRYIIIGYDADKANNVMVLRAELNLIRELLVEGFQIFIAGWPESFGKGVDDVLLGGNDIMYEPLDEYLSKFE